MKKLLFATAIILVPGFFSVSVQAEHYVDFTHALNEYSKVDPLQSGHPNHKCIDQDSHHSVLCPGETEIVGWVKTADIRCDKNNVCDLHNSYIKGNCDNFGIPVYDKPKGKIIGSLDSEPLAGYQDILMRGKSVGKYTEVRITPQGEPHDFLHPDTKMIHHECG